MRIASILFTLLLCPFLAFGQGPIATKVQKASTKKVTERITLTTNYETNLRAAGIPGAELTEGATFAPDLSAISELQGMRPEVLEVSFELPGLGERTVTLIPNKILADDFTLNTPTGEVDYQPGLYYQGILEGYDNSLVALSVFDDELHGIINTDRGNFIIAKLDGRADDLHIIYNDQDLVQPFELDCATQDDGMVYRPEDLVDAPITEDVGDCIRVYIEIDNDIVNQKGGAANATNYITGMFNESITLYNNENLAMSISEIFAWTSTSPYSSNSSSGMLSDYQNATGSFNGDLSHLVSYQASGGIAAGFSGICNSNPDNSKCFSSVSSSYSVVPVYSFSVMVVTHEMGHLIGSRHTHACVWNGNGTAIDGCAGGTEGSCPLPGSPSSGGTIMSYCHLTTGIDFTQGFGPQPGNVIRNTVANANCLSPCGSSGPNCFDGIQNGDETGVDCGGTCAPCPVPCTDNEVVITINTDNYPGETTWTLSNAGGSVVASGGPYGASGTTYSETVCVVDGCYDFTINDSYGDGICCAYGSGSYTVSSGGVTYASGGAFTSTETTNFCLGGGPTPTCDDGIQNQGETGVDCGGPCAPCPTCDDGVQNGDETGVDCGGSDCPACPTCFDGIQNGDESGVDCGGSCAPCGGGGSTVILGSYFETGWDGWQDGGGDCFRYSGSRSWEGSYSIRLRDNSGTASSMSTGGYNLSSYSSVDIEFYFYPNSMETGEDFWVRINNGSGWVTKAAYASGSSFNNGSFYVATVTLTGSDLGSNTQFRFQCDASANQDQVYIDAVTITGFTNSFPDPNNLVRIEEVQQGPTGAEPVDGVELLTDEVAIPASGVAVFPNPATNMLQVRTESEMEKVQILSATGQVVSTVSVRASQTAINVANLRPGVYYLMVEVDGELKPQRFVKQ